MGVFKVDYNVLADAVRSGKYKTYMAIAREYGVSDKTVRQASIKCGVALPERFGNPEKDFADFDKWEKDFDRQWREAVERITSA